MRDEAIARLRFEQDLRLAIDEQQFVSSISDRRDPDAAHDRARALLRWEHPDAGALGPDTFIPSPRRRGDPRRSADG